MIGTPWHHLPMPGHWTGSVVLVLFASGCLGIAVREAQRRAWIAVVRSGFGALGFACFAVANEGFGFARHAATLFFGISIAAALWHSRRTRA